MKNIDELFSFIHSSAFKLLSSDLQNEVENKLDDLLAQSIKEMTQEHILPMLNQYGCGQSFSITISQDQVHVEKTHEGYLKSEIVSEPIDNCYLNESNKQREQLILQHDIDWSPFQYGFTIDKKYHENVYKALGKKLVKGETIYATLIVNKCKYEIRFDCPNVSGRNDIVVRLLYNHKYNHPGLCLQKLLPETYKFIKDYKDLKGGRARVNLPDHLKSTLSVFSTNEPLVFKLSFTPVDSRDVHQPVAISDFIEKNEEPIHLFSLMFEKLHTSKLGGRRAPHKPLLLLAIMSLFESGELKSRELLPNDRLKETFEEEWNKLSPGITKGFVPTFATPFWHMDYEPFWTLVNKARIDDGTPSIQQLQKAEVYALLDEDLVVLLRQKASRDKLAKVIKETYFSE